jgi:hypothetical protein
MAAKKEIMAAHLDCHKQVNSNHSNIFILLKNKIAGQDNSLLLINAYQLFLISCSSELAG